MSVCTNDCSQGRNCTCTKQCESAAPEGGNVWLAEPEPIPLTLWESVTFYCCLAAISVISMALIAAAAGWIYGVMK